MMTEKAATYRIQYPVVGRARVRATDRAADPSQMTAATAEMTMAELLAAYPGAQRALFRTIGLRMSA